MRIERLRIDRMKCTSVPDSLKPGASRCLCRTCGEFFNSAAAFDMHRTGVYEPLARRCLTPAEMIARGMAVNAACLWVTEAMPDQLRTARSRSVVLANGGLADEPAPEVQP